MAGFNATRADFEAALGKHGGKIFSALQKGIQGHDYDSNWVATPSSKIFNHGLTTLPKFLQVQSSLSVDGSNFVTEHPLGVDTKTVTVIGLNPYYRVIANR